MRISKFVELVVYSLLLTPLLSYQSSAASIVVEPSAAGGDSGPAIRDAIGRAVAAGPGSEVRFGPGQYRVTTSVDEGWFFVIGGATDLKLRGEAGHTEIIFTDPRKGGFLVQHGQRVTIEDLVIDYDPPPFTQGTIVSVDPVAGEFSLRLDDGFPSLGEPWFRLGSGEANMSVAIDAHERRIKPGVSDFYFVGDWRQREAKVWTLRLTDSERFKANSLVAGDRFVVLARRGGGTFLFAGGSDCVLQGVSIHASPSLTVALIGTHSMTLRDVTVGFRDGTARLITSDGDGVHVQQNRGGPLIEGCLFEGLCDDAVNIYAPPLIVRRVIGPTQVEATRTADLRVGDTVQVFDPRAGVIRGEPVVTAMQETGDLWTLTFDRPVTPITGGADHRTGDTICNLTASGSGYVIRNNYMRFHRRHGTLLRAGGGTVENNTYEEMGGFGICISNEPGWPEGPVPSHITIRGNRFIGGGRSEGYNDSPIGAALVVDALSLNGPPPVPLARDIRIEDNRFTHLAGAAISINSARDVILSDNLTDGAPAQVRTLHTENVVSK